MKSCALSKRTPASQSITFFPLWSGKYERVCSDVIEPFQVGRGKAVAPVESVNLHAAPDRLSFDAVDEGRERRVVADITAAAAFAENAEPYSQALRQRRRIGRGHGAAGALFVVYMNVQIHARQIGGRAGCQCEYEANQISKHSAVIMSETQLLCLLPS